MNYRKEHKMQNYFPVPNEIFRLGLSDGEILVYTFLMYCEDRVTYKCYPSYATIGDAIGRSRNSVKKYVDGLVRKGLITTEPTTVMTKDGRIHNGSLCYTILPIKNASEMHFKNEIERIRIDSLKSLTEKRLVEFDEKRKR